RTRTAPADTRATRSTNSWRTTPARIGRGCSSSLTSSSPSASPLLSRAPALAGAMTDRAAVAKRCPCRIQSHRGKKLRPGTKSVQRGSRWGNPYCIPRALRHDPAAHAAAVAWFRDVHLPCHPALVAAARRDLRGHDLACACPLDLACHSDIW